MVFRIWLRLCYLCVLELRFGLKGEPSHCYLSVSLHSRAVLQKSQIIDVIGPGFG